VRLSGNSILEWTGSLGVVQDLREGMMMSRDTEETGLNGRYERTTAFIWTECAFDLLEIGTLRAEVEEPCPGLRWSHVWGPCPRCRHPLDDWQPLSAVTGLVSRSGSAEHDIAEIESIDITCGCGTGHLGAPNGMTGCGVSFRVELEPVPDSNASGRDS
jgi:hypothetical protein